MAWDFEAVRRLILTDDDEGYVCDKEAGKRLGISERVVGEIKKRGMNDYEADVLCIRAGAHPIVIFQGWCDRSDRQLEREAEEAEAGYRIGDVADFTVLGETVSGLIDGFPPSPDALFVLHKGQRVYLLKRDVSIRRRRMKV